MSGLPSRSEIDPKFKWRLEDIYANEGHWQQDVDKIDQLVGKLRDLQGHLGDSADNLLACLKLQDKIGELLEKIYCYARMRRDEDNTQAKYQAMTDKASSLNTKVDSALSFVRPELLAIPDAKIKDFLLQQPGLQRYSHDLADLLRYRPHTLTENEEELIASFGDVSQAPGDIFRMINNADLKFPTIKDEQGKDVEVTHGRFILLMESQDRRVRQDAFNALYSSYQNLRNSFASTLGYSIKKDCFFSRTRKYSSALQAALFGDNVSQDVYDNLIQTVRANLPLFNRYVEIRKRILGVEELHMYDIYAPLVKELDWKIPYEQAVEMVQEGLKPLGEEYVSIMSKGFASGWVDVHENKGKTSGAYSWGPYGVHPYILMNYHENLDNVFTLAHEMGHAMHSYYSFNEQPYTYAHYTIFVAEVASTVNESLLMHHLLNTVQDPLKKRYLINHYLEQFRGTVFRQTMFAEFEKMTHETVEQGEALTADKLSEMYGQLNSDYYGSGVVQDDAIAMEWARIPHFYSAFYVYKYATGFSAATAITRSILEEGQPAVDRYLKFLKSGGSDYPLNLLKAAGVDMATPQPVEAALKVFGQLLDEMEKLSEA